MFGILVHHTSDCLQTGADLLGTIVWNSEEILFDCRATHLHLRANDVNSEPFRFTGAETELRNLPIILENKSMDYSNSIIKITLREQNTSTFDILHI